MRQAHVPSPDEIWKILKEVSLSQKEADRRLKEMDRRFEKSKEEADRTMKETKRIVRETALQIKQTDSRWGNQWGILIESLIKGSLVKRLNERGLKVRKAVPNYQGLYKGCAKEFDLIAADGTEIVVVETKSHLSKAKVNQFLKVMGDFKKYCPEFSALTVYAGIACLRAKPETLSYAEGKGLFVIQVSGQNAVMLNKKAFRPKIFCPDSKEIRQAGKKPRRPAEQANNQ